eukprot:1148873-Pelagomonas_calceolata.AAC.1
MLGLLGMNAQKKNAKYHATLKDNLTNTGIHSAGPDIGSPFFKIAWLAQEASSSEAGPRTPESTPTPNLMYFPDLNGFLKSRMHAKHELGCALKHNPASKIGMFWLHACARVT